MNNIGLSQKAIIFNEAGEILTIRRTATAPSRPLTWDFPGGDLEHREDPKEGIIREIMEETGLEVEDLTPFDLKTKITREGNDWITVAYKAKAKFTQVVLSFEHDDFKWVTPEEFLILESDERFRDFVRRVVEVK